MQPLAAIFALNGLGLFVVVPVLESRIFTTTIYSYRFKTPPAIIGVKHITHLPGEFDHFVFVGGTSGIVDHLNPPFLTLYNVQLPFAIIADGKIPDSISAPARGCFNGAFEFYISVRIPFFK